MKTENKCREHQLQEEKLKLKADMNVRMREYSINLKEPNEITHKFKSNIRQY